LSKKKLLSQIRDPKILFVEIAFPLIILIAFFGFSKIEFKRPPVSIDLNVDQFPNQALLIDGDLYKKFPTPNNAAYTTPSTFLSNSITCSLNVCHADFWTNA